jgi:hypothetical protein
MPIHPSQTRAVFGRRGSRAPTPVLPPNVAAQIFSGSQYAKPKAEPFIVRYNWKIAALGASLLGMTYKAYGAISGADHGWEMMRGTVPVSQEVASYAILGVGMGIIGLLWLSRFFSSAPALKMDEKGVKGFTLLGTKYIAWEDVEYVKIEYHQFYKEQILIRAVVGSPTGGHFLYGIPLKTAALDRSRKEIVEAIRSFAPDVAILDATATGKTARTLASAFTWLIKHSHH